MNHRQYSFQKKNEQLLEQNQRLLNHIRDLLIYTHQLEEKIRDGIDQCDKVSSMKSLHCFRFENDFSFQLIPPRPNNLGLPPSLVSSLSVSDSIRPQSNLSHDSPDSGKGNEISSDSFSDPFQDQSWDNTLSSSLSHSKATNEIFIEKTITSDLIIEVASFTNLAFSQSPLRACQTTFDDKDK